MHKYTVIVYSYIFIISPQTPKTGPPHHLCTTAVLRVNKCRTECSQPIGVVVNNRQSECEHGEWRLCTNGNDTIFTVLLHLHEYTESPPFHWHSDSRNKKNLEMQDLLLRDVRKLRKTFLSQYRMIKACTACRFFKQTPLANRANTSGERSLLFSKRVIHYNFSISSAERPVT